MKRMTIACSFLLAFLLAGCGEAESALEFTARPAIAAASTQVTAAPAQAATADWFTERDLSGAYDAASAVTITLTGETAQVSGSGAEVSGSTVTISQSGVYLVSGKLNDGQILVDAGKSDKIQLVLDGADITGSTSAAIYIKKADKVFVTLAAGSQNTLTNGGSYTAIDENTIDSVIFSKADLTLNGTGSLTVEAKAGHGIVSKDDLTIGGGTYQIMAAEHGITAKDTLAIAAGSLRITAGEDGIHAKNSDDISLGNCYIADGDIVVESAGDGIFAAGTLQIGGGSFRLTTGGGSKAVTMKASDTWGGFGRTQTQTTESETSAKGLKSDGSMAVFGGTFLLDTADDSVHTGGDLWIGGGDWTISSADDGLHADSNVTIQDGSFSIPYCYEGVEGQNVTIDGGSFEIEAKDDGINAAGGMDGSGDFRAPGMAGNNAIVINGGTIQIVSDGDSLDSNGSITLNGGKLNLTCNGNGNTAVDCDGNYSNNGAEITTNDGSENGGGFGMQGGKRGSFGGTAPEGFQRPEGSQRPEGMPAGQGGKGMPGRKG